MARVVRALGIGAGVLAGLGIVLASTGWLYFLRPAVPGPRITDGLPLDELSKHDGVPLLLLLGVWTAAGLLLGLIARSLRAERLTSALLLALGVGLWCYLADGVSLLVVRQIPAHEAFGAAATLRSVYVPAVVAGLAGAVTGRSRETVWPRSPLVLAVLVAATGGLGVLDGILPARPHTLLAQLAPERVQPIASALVVPLGLALIVLARGLARRQRRALHLSIAFLLGLIALHALHGFDYGASAAGLVVVCLVARRQDFDALGDPASKPRVLVRATLAAAAIFLYGLVAIWVNRVTADQPFTVHFALRETWQALAALHLGGSKHLGDGFGQWFPISVFVAGLASAAWLLHAWLAPWRYRLSQEARERELARALVGAWGVDTLAPFALRADKSYFFSLDERAFLAYKVVAGVAIVSGDPIGPPEEFDELVTRFIGFAHGRGWRVAILGVSERCVDLYRRHGLHALYHGDEAVVETASFSLEGRAVRKVRQSVHRLQREGYRAELLHAHEIGSVLRAELDAVAREWRGAEPERGFVMALDALFRLDDKDAVFAVAFGPGGRPAGFLHFAVCCRASALSLSSMPRLRETPNGFTEWLICETVDWARERGFERVSLNFAPFAALLAPEAVLSGLQRVERRALLALKGHFQLDNLLLFNRKFLPSWQRRFVVYERRRDLPRVGIAALAAEAYLPFTGRARP
jgi:lysyl-tRNA synthetase, class II